MKSSLRSTLLALIKEKGYVPSEEIYRVCNELGYRFSNAERRLRHSESPDIEPVMAISKRGTSYIKGYKWKEGAIYFVSPSIMAAANKFGVKVEPPYYPTTILPPAFDKVAAPKEKQKGLF